MFKPIKYKDVKDKYSISREGIVINRETGSVMKSYKNKNGYYIIKLKREKYQAPVLLHRLVAEAYIGSTENLQVNHKDGNKGNNHVDNLELVSAQENTIHAYKHNLCQVLENKYNASLTNEQVHLICKLLEDGKSYKEIEKIVPVKRDVLKKIKSRDNYKDISKNYNFKKVNRRLMTNDEKLVKKINKLLDKGIVKQREITNILEIEYSKKNINLIKYIKRRRRLKERSTTIEKVSK